MKNKLLAVDGFAQVGLDFKTGDDLLAQSLVEEFEACLAIGFGVIHRGVGIAQKFFRCVAGGAEGDSDAGGDEQAAALEVKRLAKPFEQYAQRS